MKRGRVLWVCLLLAALFASVPHVWALDPPMDFPTNGVDCLDCHTPHSGDGDTLTVIDGNSNLCISCHSATGIASEKPFADADQAIPGTSGTSHRFDSGPSGWVKPATPNTGTGTVTSGGTFTGRIERTYTLTITTAGNVGTARFGWTDTASGSGTNVLSGTSVALSSGITATFTNGTTPSFALGDVFTIRVRTDLRLPSAGDPDEEELALRLANGTKVVCSTCHNQHSQANAPADQSAPAYTGPGTGNGRHYQRATNSTNEMCLICHESRNVTTSDDGSHPVGVAVGSGVPSTYFQSPADLATIGGAVYCTTCHSPHFTDSGGANAGAGDGYLLDKSIGTLCYQCHTLADAATASHLSATSGVLWPAGQYGSTFPVHTSEKRGYCVNCHWPHGWPDDSDTNEDYPTLWVEQYDVSESGQTDPTDAEDLCFTCHDGSPATSDIRTDIIKGTNSTTETFHHPVKDSEQVTATTGQAGRYAECISCHNPHRATSTDRHAYVAGVDINGTAITAGSRTLLQYELCFKCHGNTYNSARTYDTYSNTSSKRTDFATTASAYHPVVQAGRNTSANLTAQLRGGLTTSSTIKCSDCHASNSFSATVGAITDSTSVTVGPHGSTYAPILRANLNRRILNGTGPSSYSSTNFTLCFGCHLSTTLTERDRSSGARTNFNDDGCGTVTSCSSDRGKDNLHWVHLVDRISKSKATCSSCHYDIHGNYSATNTQYNINGTVYATIPAMISALPSGSRIETHMVNFSPDITATGGRPKPEWWVNTTTKERRCFLSCHGYSMSYSYVTASGDDTSWTY